MPSVFSTNVSVRSEPGNIYFWCYRSIFRAFSSAPVGSDSLSRAVFVLSGEVGVSGEVEGMVGQVSAALNNENNHNEPLVAFLFPKITLIFKCKAN